MASFELNSRLYTKPEIEDILSLTYPYTVENVDEQKKILFVELSNDQQLRGENKTDLATFVEEISSRLVEGIVVNEESKVSLREIPVGQMIRREKSPSSSSSSLPSFLRNDNSNTMYPGDDHDVIYNKKAEKEAEKASLNDGLHVDEAGAPPGVINPLQYRTIKRAVNIDSRFRPNYFASKASDMQLTLPTRLEKVISMRLGALELPNSFYAISEELGNNCFKINLIMITIPDGNYSSSSADTQYPQIADAINTAMANASTPITDLDFSVDQASGKSVFTKTSTNLTTYTITFGVNKDGTNSSEKLPYFLGWQLGYRANQYTVSKASTISNPTDEGGDGNNGVEPIVVPDDPDGGGELEPIVSADPIQGDIALSLSLTPADTVDPVDSVDPVDTVDSVDANGGGTVVEDTVVTINATSEGQCQISGPRYLYLALDDYNNNVNNYFVSAFSDSINSRNILSRIDLPHANEDGYGSQINRTRNYFGPVNIEKMQIRLLDEYGRVINMNNMDWSFTLMFECMY